MKATRSGVRAPSGLAKAVKDFASAGTRRVAYMDNKWIVQDGDKLYVRKWKADRLELSHWSFRHRGTGHATRLLEYLESTLARGGIPQSELYVENVVNERFASFFRRRNGWSEETTNSPSPSFLFGHEPRSRLIPSSLPSVSSLASTPAAGD